jgi:tetratricopeptide (TPR) repeat protein
LLKRIGISLSLLALVWAVFGQTLHHQFVNYDDPAYVLENPHVRAGLTWNSVQWAFTHVHGQNWHPLTSISHMLDCQLFGINPRWHHAGNVLLHSLAAALLFVALARVTNAVWPSAFVAAVFAVHPLRVESVAWIAERKDVLSGLFFMLTLLAYVAYVRRRSNLRYAVMALLFACGLMSKPMLVTMPIVLLLLDYWPLQRVTGGRLTNPKLIVEKMPLFLLSAGSIAATLLAQNLALGSADILPLGYRVGNAAVSYVIYIGQMFWPYDLVPFYMHSEGELRIWQWASAAALLVCITILVFVRRRRNPYLLVGWFWYLVMLLPVIGIIQVGLQGHADRYTYLPQIGLYLASTWLLCNLTKEWQRRTVILALAAGLVVLTLMTISWRQAARWRDTETLWRYTLSVTPESDVGHTGLGGILLAEGKLDQAADEYNAALAIRSGNSGAQYGLAGVLARQGKTDAAIEHYRAAIEVQPDNTAASNALALLLVGRGDYAGAISQWENTLRFEADDGNALSNLAWVLATCTDPHLRDPRKAVEYAEHANQLAKGTNAIVLRTLAVAYAQNQRFDDAIAAAQRGISVAETRGQGSVADDLRHYLETFVRARAGGDEAH